MKTLNLLVISIILLSHLSSARSAESDDIFVSIKPIHSIVAGLMKDLPSPQLLITGPQSPYDYIPSAKQIAAMQKAKLVIWVGAELERHLAPVIADLPASVTVIELLSDPAMKVLPARLNPDNRDPIFWMDERNILITLDSLAHTLIEVDPKRSHIYTRNRYNMIVPLRRLDKQHEFGYRGMKAGIAVQYYDTLQYFEQAYALGVLERFADSPFQEPQSDNLLMIHKLLKDQDANCLLLDISLDEKNAHLLSDGTQANVAELDVFGLNFEPGPEMYIKLMQYNSDTIKQCLNASKDEAEQARLDAQAAEMVTVDGIGGHFILSNHLGQMVTDTDLEVIIL